MQRPTPRRPVPPLTFQLTDGRTFDIHDRKPEHFTMLVVYRGHHCPLCRKQLEEFERLHDDYAKLGVELVAVSANDGELANRTTAEWGLSKLPVGHGLTLDDARTWGLFGSAAIKPTEPEHFVEPGLFVIRPDGTLYASVTQTMPFSRPTGAQLLSSLTWIIENDYPARGEAEL